MPLLLGFLCLIFLLLFALVAQFFTVDVLFHEVLPNNRAAAIIAAVSGVLLIGTAFAIVKSDYKGAQAVGVFLAIALLLLLFQPVLQSLGRSYTRVSLEAEWKDLQSGLKISNLADELITTASGRPIGLRLSFDLTLAQAGSFQFFPNAKSESAPPHFLEPVRFERRPAPDSGEAKSHFDANKTYRLSYDLVPSILAWDRDNEAFCLRYPGTGEFFRMAQSLDDSSQMRIELDGVLVEGGHQSFDFETNSQARYDIKAMGEAGQEEAFPLCGPKVAKHLLYED